MSIDRCRCSRQAACLGLVASALLLGPAALANDGGAEAAIVSSRVKSVVNGTVGITRSEFIRIDIDAAPGEAFAAPVLIDGVEYTLDLAPHSVRSPGYALYVGGPDELVQIEPGPVRTVRGTIMESPGARVIGALHDDGLHLMIDLGPMHGGDRYWIEPISRLLGGAGAPGIHVVYHDSDRLPSGGTCATDQGLAALVDTGLPNEAATDGGGCNEVRTAELALDCDNQYYNDWGSGTENRVNLVINLVDGQYEDQVEIVHFISGLVIRTSPTYTTNDAFTLLNQFRNRWLSQHGDIHRDVAHLFTGRNLNGGTIGIAWTIGGICTSSAYCLSESDCCGGIGCATDLTAHELGHLWGAFHCDPCNATMRSFIGCFNNFVNGSVNSIISHRNSRSCLTCGPLSYCEAEAVDTSGGHINRVTLGTIDNPSGSNGYADFSGLSTTIERGENQMLTVELGSGDAADIGGVWIDWNQDDTFNDPDEALNPSWSGAGVYTWGINVPPHAVLGATRLRIRVQDGEASGSLSPCGNTGDGEVEDYSLLIVDNDPAPANDDCADATEVADGSHPYTNIGATTDGLESAACDLDGYRNVDSDVWFAYTAPCTGLVTASVCDADYDTKLALYQTCPDINPLVLSCNDDSCGDGSLILFVGIEGTTYYIRVGGYLGQQGSGTLFIDCDSLKKEPCPADIDGSGSVGLTDLLAVLSSFGPCPGCPEDLDEDGNVGFTDIIAVLSTWGPCP